jgi:hypothetical protein
MFPPIVVVPVLALKDPVPPTAAKLSVPDPAFRVPLIVVVPDTVMPRAPAPSTDELCRLKVPARLKLFVTSDAPVALPLSCTFPSCAPAFSVAVAPVMTSVPFVAVPPKLFDIATFPEEVIVFTAVFVIVPALVKFPTVRDPEVSSVPAAPIVSAFVNAFTLPPLAMTSVPPVTWFVTPFKLKVLVVGTTRLPPESVKVPETDDVVPVIVPELTVRFV